MGEDYDLKLRLRHACREGDIEIVRSLVRQRLFRGPRLDVNAPFWDSKTALMTACERGHTRLAEYLIEEGADVNAVDKNGTPALYYANDAQLITLMLSKGANTDAIKAKLDSACRAGDVAIARRLLSPPPGAQQIDINEPISIDEYYTALGEACKFSHLEMARFLLDEAKVNVNADCRYPALHAAAGKEMIELLMSRGANINAINFYGETALHVKANLAAVNDVKVLLRFGARLDIANNDGCRVLPVTIYGTFSSLRSPVDKRLEVLQELVRYGAEWDDVCEAMVHGADRRMEDDTSHQERARWRSVGPAVQFAVQFWIEERDHGMKTFTRIPGEEIERGLQATRTYVRERMASKLIVCRRTICVVGPSTVGKTSLVKSLLKNDACLEHIDDRTIGIDHFMWEFDEPDDAPPRPMMRKHQVVFSDFAGQTVYQVMHSLFFTRRTLFMICVDLNAYSIALLKAEMLTQDDARKQHLMNEYVDSAVLSWVRIILARQSEAEFVFVCTKHDTVSSGPGVDEHEVLVHVSMMLERVMAIVEDMRRINAEDIADEKEKPDCDSRPVVHLWDPRLEKSAKPDVMAILTSSRSTSAVQITRKEIERLVVATGQSYEMPEKHVLVLQAITKMRSSVEGAPIHTRVQATIEDVDVVIEKLCKKIPRLDPVTAEAILRSLRDCSDILWYEDMENKRLQTTVMLDPKLLIEFLKQVINHKHVTGIAYHSMLAGLPYWRDVSRDSTLLLAMKTLLHDFHLAHPATGKMKVDSDLIVPAFWKTNRAAVWEFGGEELRLDPHGRDSSAALVAKRRVHWEVRFTHFIPHTLFDLLVVASYSPSQPLQVGPDWIMYEDPNLAACRVVVSRHWKTHERSLHLEAVVAETVTTEDREKLMWKVFKRICRALARVLKEHPGLAVTSCARTNKEDHVPSLSSILRAIDRKRMVDVRWMPPKAVSSKCVRLVVGSRFRESKRRTARRDEV